MYHVARVEDLGETFWFVSLDGDTYLPVNQEPTADMEAEVRELFAEQERHEWKSIRYARRFLAMQEATFTEVGQ